MPSFRLVTWNINSIRIRLDLLQRLTDIYAPDIICLQEVKAKSEDFPFEAIKSFGLEHIALYSMPSYNGVAILSKIPLADITPLDWVGKHDARHIKATIFGDIEINSLYIPAGGDIPDPIINLSFAHKLCFMDDISEYFEQHEDALSKKKMLICGDFNVAPSPNDVWNHKQLLKIISHTPIETGRLDRLFNSLDFTDAVRQIYPEPEKIFSWWSYRNPSWMINNKGRRLDHIWVTEPLKKSVFDVQFLKEFRSAERPSDHIPVLIDLKI